VNESICATMNTPYASPPGSSLKIFFSSMSPDEEYEGYENEPQIHPVNLDHHTWGSGWTATYRQVCDPRYKESGPIVVKASSNVVMTQRSLPGFVVAPRKPVQWFLAKDWLIVPEQSGCKVNIALESGFDDRGFRYPDDDAAFPFYTNESREFDWSYRDENHFITLTFTSERPTVLLRQVATNPQISSRIRFFQVCPMPTGSPTRSPTDSTDGPSEESLGEGESCGLSEYCLSGICSATMRRCTAQSCSSTCGGLKNSTGCVSHSSLGCSCRWTTSTGSCTPVP